MKKLVFWTVLAIIIMICAPWLTVACAGENGMAVCMLLFFAINPLFLIICGIYAGQSVKRLWFLPVITAGLFLAGAWIFFDYSETTFLLYSGFYLIIGTVSMLTTSFFKSKTK